MMKISVIISVYKDIEALAIILESLNKQTVKEFEIIISEDGNSDEIREFLNSYKHVKHYFQDDLGWRKNRALNSAIKNSTGEYLIFIDGDIVPYSDFVEQHINLAESKKVLIGKRMELGKYFSKILRKRLISPTTLEKMFLPLLAFIAIDKDTRHIEEGIKLKKGNAFGDKIRSKNKMIVGCNFSCYKKDLETINGFDEEYIEPSVGEDYDLVWRFQHFGIEMKSVRNLANVFHLWHLRRWSDEVNKKNKEILNLKRDNKEYFCKNGLIKK